MLKHYFRKKIHCMTTSTPANLNVQSTAIEISENSVSVHTSTFLRLSELL